MLDLNCYHQPYYEYSNSSLLSFADSQTTTSLRHVNPEGVHTSPPPTPDASTHNKISKPIQKPGFVVNREDSTVGSGSVPPFPPKPGVPLLRHETEDSLKLTGGFLFCLGGFFSLCSPTVCLSSMCVSHVCFTLCQHACVS